METLTTDNQVTAALRQSIDIQNGNSEPEMVEVFDVWIAQKGKDFNRDQGYINWAQRKIKSLEQQLKAHSEHSFKSDCFLSTALDEFEARFKNEGGCDSPEIAIWYMAAAKHLEGLGRKSHLIDEVDSWLYSPVSSPKSKTA